MTQKAYAKIEGVQGTVKVSGYENFFEVSRATGGPVSNGFNGTNNTASYRGTPQLSTYQLVLDNCPGEVSSKLHQDVLNSTPLTSVEIHQITKLNKKESTTHKVVLEEPHILNYELDPNTKAVYLELGNMKSIEETHYNVQDDGTSKPYVVKYDMTKHEAS